VRPYANFGCPRFAVGTWVLGFSLVFDLSLELSTMNRKLSTLRAPRAGFVRGWAPHAQLFLGEALQRVRLHKHLSPIIEKLATQ
jgi:hypothetical protein